jgi:hypothetical protein
MVKRANDAFDAAVDNGWSAVDVHVEAPLISKDEALERWSATNRVPRPRDMSRDAVAGISVHCSDGVVDLPILRGSTGAGSERKGT